MAILIIFPVIPQTVINLIMLSTVGQGLHIHRQIYRPIILVGILGETLKHSIHSKWIQMRKVSVCFAESLK